LISTFVTDMNFISLTKLDIMKINCFSLLTLFLLFFGACNTHELEEPGNLVPLTVTEDPSIPSININGIALHSETFGNPADPMVVVIHGGPGADYKSLLNYQQLAANGVFVVFYDQRGCGLSERVDKNQFSSVQVYIDELDGVINHYRQNNNQKLILAGHSWGAMLATAYINQKPDHVSGVILTEPGGFTWDQTLDYINRSRPLELFDEFANDFLYQDQFITGSDHQTLDYKMALSTAGAISTGDPISTPYWRYGGVCNIASVDLAMKNPEQMDFTANLDNFHSKVLFAYSELNPAYGLEHAILVSAAFSNVELVKINGSGHEIPEFGWNNLYPIITNYLTEIL